MRIIAKTADLDRKSWLALRTHYLGGSDIAALCGLSAFKSTYELWLEKTGQIEPDESQTEAAFWGSKLEDVVRKTFTERAGLKVRKKNMLLGSSEPELSFVAANLDGLITEGTEKVIFEAKTSSSFRKAEWDQGVPIEYVLQVNHYFLATGLNKAYVAVLIGGNDFRVYTLFRDEELIRNLIEIERHFWEHNVLGNHPPAIDGSPATTKYLNKKYDMSNGETIQLPDEALSVLQQYDDITGKLDQLTKEKDKLTNQLKLYLGESECGIVDDRKVSWKTIQTKRFDKKKFELENPEVYQDYIAESSYRRLQVA